MDISKFFVKKGKSLIFDGDTLEVFIPDRYNIHGYLHVEDTIKTIGFFDMIINGKYKTGYKLGASIEIIPSSIDMVTKGTRQFVKANLKKGDVFIKDLTYIENTTIAYVLFYEMAYSGNYPDFMSYKDTCNIYDYIANATGVKFAACHTIFELISAQLFRANGDISTMYRNTDMTKKPTVMGLHSIAQVATSVTGKINGAYTRQGLESSIANEADPSNSDIEDLLRS